MCRTEPDPQPAEFQHIKFQKHSKDLLTDTVRQTIQSLLTALSIKPLAGKYTELK